MTSFEPGKPTRVDPKLMTTSASEVRHGTRGGRPDVRMLGGYFTFDSPDAALPPSAGTWASHPATTRAPASGA
jgi:hypothetical protein